MGKEKTRGYNAMANSKVIGIRELRQNLSDVIDLAINKYQEIIAGNKVRGNKTVSLVSTETINILLENYKFNPKLSFDKTTNQYYVYIPEIDVDGIGDTKEQAIDILLDNIEISIEDYFKDTHIYMNFEKYRSMYPYFLKLKRCFNRDDFLKTLNLVN